MAEQKKYTLMNTVAVLSVSTLLYLAAVNAASIPFLIEEFGKKNGGAFDDTTIKLFATIPSLMMIVCSLVSGKLIEIFPIKTIVLGCSVIMLVAGFGTYFVFNFPTILALRVVYGMGSGTVFPLANALIQQLYEGDEKARLLGFRAAFGALFGTAVTLVGGWLTSLGWRNAFFGYLFAIPVGLLVLFFCPTNEPIKKEKATAAAGEKKYTKKTFYVLLFVILFNACMMSFNVELPIVIKRDMFPGDTQELKAAAANAASLVASVNTLFAFLAGLVFGALQKATRRYMAVISTGLVGLALVGLCFVQAIPLFVVGGAIFGLGFGFYNPTYNLLIASTAAQPKFGAQAIAIYTSCVGLGQFLSPYLINGIKTALNLTIPRAEWVITGTITAALVIGATIYITVTGGKEERKSS